MTGGNRSQAGKVVPLKRKNRKCPLCGKPSQESCRPFCSKRCADLDLGRWLGERYRIPGETVSSDVVPEDEEEP
jgi:endogenous inhibitor of DNA gyrase (YacG/DUF329 family)